MIRSLRVACAALLALSLFAPAAQALDIPFRNKGNAPAASVPVPVGVWAHEESDLAPDPQVRFGRLANGMRYALMKNATPTGQASIRLQFAAGSLMETDAQQGLAHFLEHMAFNGSKNVPEGEMIKILERHGLSFGADTNASTSWSETIYKLDLPKADDATVDASLMLLREGASNLLIEQAAVDRERGVVLSEERTRDSPGLRVFRAREAFMLPGQLASRRVPIGLAEVIRTAPASQIRAFYETWYRPERTVLVAVGDFDVDAMEARIKARFSDWKANAQGAPEPALGAPAKRGVEAKVVVEPGAPVGVEMAWLSPPRYVPDTQAEEARSQIEQLAIAVLNRRLERLARADTPPFIGASADKGDEFHSAEMTSLSVRAETGAWKAALTAAEHEQRRLVQYGVRQDELDREIQELRTRLQSNVAQAATRRTPNLANNIVAAIDRREVVRSPSQELESFDVVVKDLKAETVSAAARAMFAGSGPLLFVSSPVAIEGDAAAVKAAYEDAASKPVDAPTAEAVKPWPYTNFGKPGAVASRKEVLDLDADFITFENGVKLTVKPTKFRDDQILVAVRVGGGRASLTGEGRATSWMAGQVFTEGALKRLSMEELERIMAPRIVGANLSIGDDAFVLSGTTRPEDFDIQLQMLTAFLTEPGYRPEVFARWRSLGPSLQDQYESTPGGVLRRDLPALLRSGDPRWSFPTRDEMAGASLDDLRTLLRGVDPSQPIEVVIVGDITVDKAVAAVAATLGALPRPVQAAPADGRPIAFPAASADVVMLKHKGRADQALGYIAWPTDDFFADVPRARAVRMLGYVMQLRLIDQLRESQGATYSPSADSSSSFVFRGYGFLAATVEVPPSALPAFFRDVQAIAADLRDKAPTVDELARAKDSRVQALEKSRQTNEYWLDALAGAQADPRRLEAVRSAVSGLERVTPADVQAVAKTYLDPAKAWKLQVVAEAK